MTAKSKFPAALVVSLLLHRLWVNKNTLLVRGSLHFLWVTPVTPLLPVIEVTPYLLQPMTYCVILPNLQCNGALLIDARTTVGTRELHLE